MFPCSGCGLCCQNISTVQELKEFDLGNGVCKYYDIQNKSCNIYENRPDICRIDVMYTTKYHQYYTQDVYYKKNAEVCNQLQTIYQIDQSYRVKIRGE